MRKIAVLGGGGFGRMVLDLLDDINAAAATEKERFEVVGVLDDGEVDGRMLEPWGVEHLGPMSLLDDMPAEVGYTIAIGAPAVRRAVDERFRRTHPSPVLVHPTVTCGRAVHLEAGVVLLAGARLCNHIELGRHVHVNLNCSIGHDVVLGDYTTVSPLVAVSGNVAAGTEAFFGTGVTVNPGLEVGDRSVVGSGGVVVRPVDADVTVTGVPARPPALR